MTARELEVADLITKGLSNDEIAEVLCVANSTVASHIKNLSGKLSVNNRVKIAVIVVQARYEMAL